MKQTLIVSLLTLASTTWANPELEQIVSGEVSLTTQDNTLTVHQSSDAAWIDWHSFSIAEQETVIFQLLNAQGLSVNRVTGDDVSSLFGQLQSNGTVYLINPNGILFGEHARVDVGGLFATDHWLDEQGNLTPSSHSSGIQVLGTIQSREQLTLLANGVTNAGHLSADTVNLLANEGALLSLDETGAVSVLVPATSGNSWVEHSGVIVANGRVYIGSVDTNSWLNQLAAENQVTVSGQIQADQIAVQGTDVELLDAQLSAALIDIESRDTTYLSGADVTSTNGNVRIRGDEIQVFNGTTIDVGSGELTVGGRLQGQGHDHNANFVHVSSTVHLYGNGGELGNGGEIIIWSDGSTSFHGTIQAQGGSQGGDGGFVEVSGKETLVFRGNVDTTAAEGKTGTLLLDPTDIIIADGSGGANDGAVSDGIIASGDAPATMTISEQALENLSSATNITLQASQSITINDLSDNALTLNQSNSVTFDVQNSAGEAIFQMLDLNDSIDMTGGGNLNITVAGNTAITSPAKTATVSLGDINMTAGGNLFLWATTEGSGTTSDEITVTIGDVTITGDGSVSILADNTENNDVSTVDVTTGSISITGTGGNFVDITARTEDQVASNAGNSTINVLGTINVNGDGSAGHYVSVATAVDAVTAGTINLSGDIIVPAGDITVATNSLSMSDATPALNTYNGTSLGSLTVTHNSFDAGGGALTLAGVNSELINFAVITNLGALTLTTQNDFTFGNAGAVSAADITALSGISSLTLNTFGSITTDAALTDFAVNLNADIEGNGTGDVSLNGLTTGNNNLSISAATLSGTAVATDVGTGSIVFNSANGGSMSVNGSAGFNISGAVWNNLNASQVTLQGTTGANQIFWEHSTLGTDVILDGSAGAGVVFQNGPFNFAGANTLRSIGDTLMLSDLTMSNTSSLFTVNGALTIGEVGGADIAIAATWNTAGISSIELAGDNGDTVTLSKLNSADFYLPQVTSTNDVNLVVEGIRGVNMIGADVGSLTVNLDTNDNGGNRFVSSGTFNVTDFLVNGTLGIGNVRNEGADINGTWTIAGTADFTNLNDVVFLNDSFTAGGDVALEAGTTLTLGASVTTFSLTSTSGSLNVDNINSGRDIALTAAGAISAGVINAAANAISITSDSDLVGDESISLSGVTAGSLTLAGDFSWNFNPTLTGAYQQTKGDVTLTDTTLRASSVDMSLADSVTLTGTATVIEATAGNVGINGLTGAASDLTINASGDINLDSIALGTGDLTLRSDTDASGDGTAFLNIGSGNALTLNSQSSLSGAINFNQLSSSAVVTLSDATLTLNSLDTSAWTGGVLTGTSNSVTATIGNIAVSNWVQGAGSSSLSLTATGAVDVSGVTVGNQLTVNSATNQTTLTTVAANGLNANDDNLTLTGNLQLNSLVTSGSLSLTDAALAVTGFDSGDYTQVSFAGTSNSLTVNGGNLILNTPTMTLGSDLSLNVGAGSHVLTHLNVGSGDIQINGVAATSNQTVTANGAWTFDQLTVAGIDTFINNAQLNGTSLVTIATTNDIDLNDSSALSAERIELTADDDIWLTGLASASPQIPSIVVRAGGDILDGGDTQFDIDAYWEESVDLQAGGTIDNSLLFQYDVVVDLELDAGIDLSTDTNDLVISDASESKNPTQSSQASVGSLPRSSVDVYLPECTNGSKDCRKTSALRKFLSSLLVGGALPE